MAPLSYVLRHRTRQDYLDRDGFMTVDLQLARQFTTWDRAERARKHRGSFAGAFEIVPIKDLFVARPPLSGEA